MRDRVVTSSKQRKTTARRPAPPEPQHDSLFPDPLRAELRRAADARQAAVTVPMYAQVVKTPTSSSRTSGGGGGGGVMKHRVHDWISFNVRNLESSSASSGDFRPSPERLEFDFDCGSGEVSLIRVPAAAPAGTDHGGLAGGSDGCSSSATSYFYSDERTPRTTASAQRTKQTVVKVPVNFNDGRSGSMAKSYDSTGPNDERYYVSPTSKVDASEPGPRSLPPDRRGPSNSLQQADPPLLRSMIEIPIKSKKRTYLFGTSQATADETVRSNKSLGYIRASSNKSAGELIDIPDPDYSPIVIRRGPNTPKQTQNSNKLWGNASRYKGSLEDELDKAGSSSSSNSIGGRDSLHKAIQGRPKVKELVHHIKLQSEQDRLRQQMRQELVQVRSSPTKSDEHNNSRNGSRMTDYDDEADEIYRDLLNVVEREKRHLLYASGDDLRLQRPRSRAVSEQRRLQQPKKKHRHHYDESVISVGAESGLSQPPRWRGYSGSSSLMSSSQGHSQINMRPAARGDPYEEVMSKQSHFFNSLFPSRANRFGFPVYPQRHFGIPSPEGSGPVSFAGFTPDLHHQPFYEPDIDAQEITTSSSTPSTAGAASQSQSFSLFSAVPKMLKPKTSRKKKEGKRSFFSFFY